MALKKIGVLLVNLGSPSAPTIKAVRRFLKDFLWDPRVVNLPRVLWWIILHAIVLPFRPKKSAMAYQKIWHEKGSPLTFLTRQLTEKVAAKLASETVSVSYAMSYGEPAIADRLNEFSQQGVTDLVVLPLYPQYSSTTTASVYDAMVKELNRWRHVPTIRFISDYHQDSRYIDAVADSIEQYWREKSRNELLILSFHGLPEQLTKWGDPYFYHCQKSAALIAEKLSLSENQWQLVFQSRFGRAEWLKPYCVEVLKNLPKQGIKKIDIVCPGFAVDCLETLEEIAMQNKDIFLEAGGESYQYIPALNDSMPHVEALVNLLDLKP